MSLADCVPHCAVTSTAIVAVVSIIVALVAGIGKELFPAAFHSMYVPCMNTVPEAPVVRHVKYTSISIVSFVEVLDRTPDVVTIVEPLSLTRIVIDGFPVALWIP